jgi:GH25 family lysozyme M1 (1,4-beta-N-acetylmuramidase)
MFKGYDLSSVQGLLHPSDFVTMKNNGTDFIIAKCTQGNDGGDPCFLNNIKNAQAAGLAVAAYHFVYCLPNAPGHINRDPVDQANLHFKAANGIPAFCDAEWPEIQNWAQWNTNANQINQWLLTYLQTYSALMGRPMPIYTFPNFAQTVGFTSEFTNYELWIASYDDNTPLIPSPWTTYSVWQNSGGTTAKLPNGAPVDTDLAVDLHLFAPLNSSSTVIQAPADPVIIAQPSSAPQPAPPVQQQPTNIWSSLGNSVSSAASTFSNLFKKGS